jgi:hypothetical protein
MMTADTASTSETIRIRLGGETRYASAENWQKVADELHAKHGGVPEVVNLDTPKKLELPPAPPSNPIPAVTAPAPISGGAHDVIGEGRSRVDFDAAMAAGFAPAQTIYRRGTRVIDLGIENARASRQAHDALPSVTAACASFETLIENEARRDETVDTSALRMTKDGLLALPDVAGREGFGPRLALTESAFASLVVSQHSGIGGAGYLTKCWPELRAINVNHWLAKFATDEIAERNALPADKVGGWKRHQLALRTRKARPGAGPKREVFGVVSTSYTAFDVDRVARAVALAMPRDAKADITYDGRRAVFDIRFHSDVQPEHYVCGEFFKAGIRIKTDDTGSGSLSVSSTVFQNLCLNLIIIDEATQGLARIRHTGDEATLAKKLEAALVAGRDSLGHFLKAWGYAVEDKLERFDVADGIEVPIKLEDALPGIFDAMIERELVPVRGRRAEVVEGLMMAWGRDDSAAAGRTRGAIVNAITRYAHEGQDDPWYEDELERAAGRLAYSRAPLPYAPIEK